MPGSPGAVITYAEASLLDSNLLLAGAPTDVSCRNQVRPNLEPMEVTGHSDEASATQSLLGMAVPKSAKALVDEQLDIDGANLSGLLSRL